MRLRLPFWVGLLLMATVGCGEKTPSRELSLIDHMDDAELGAPQSSLASIRNLSELTARIHLAGEGREAITVPVPSSVSFSIELPPNTEFLFSLALIPSSSEAGGDLEEVEFRVWIECEGQRARVFGTLLRSPTWQPRRADLTPWSGKPVVLTLETRPVSEGGDVPRRRGLRAAWGEPVLTSGLHAGRIGQAANWFNLWHGRMGRGASSAREEEVADTRFSHDRGFYELPFTVSITSATSGTTVVYTLDGSEPTPAHGIKGYRVRIDRTTVLRAMAYQPGMKPTNVDTHTYIFPATVKNQPVHPPGFPERLHSSYLRRRQLVTQWYLDHPEHEESLAASRNRPLIAVGPWLDLDAEIDPDIVGGANEGRFIRGLLSLPTLSVAMDPDDLFDPEKGIYVNHHLHGPDWERRVSVELLYPEDARFEGFQGFQIDCGIRMHGGLAGNAVRKRSFRLLFKNEHGRGKLRYPFFESAVNHAGSAAAQFDTLVLRAGGNANWSSEILWDPVEALFTRDQLIRDTQLSLSGISARGVFVHLYLNGIYWGLYNAVERPDQGFLASYRGGEPEHWYALNHGGPLGKPWEVQPRRWEAMHRFARENDLSDPPRYQVLKTFLDTAVFADYVMLNWYAGMGDWGEHNWYGAMRNEPPGRGFYLCWDSELTYGLSPRWGSPVAWVDPSFPGGGSSSLHRLWKALIWSPLFRLEFADRVYRACRKGGPLEDDVNRARFKRLCDYVEDAIVCESARWGDASRGRDGQPHDNDEWKRERDLVLNYRMKGNAERFLEALRAKGYYPSIEPPAFERNGDRVIVIKPSGVDSVYYTTDGSDPAGPGVSSFRTMRKTLAFSPRLRARSKQNQEWSALNAYVDGPGVE